MCHTDDGTVYDRPSTNHSVTRLPNPRTQLRGGRQASMFVFLVARWHTTDTDTDKQSSEPRPVPRFICPAPKTTRLVQHACGYIITISPSPRLVTADLCLSCSHSWARVASRSDSDHPWQSRGRPPPYCIHHTCALHTPDFSPY